MPHQDHHYVSRTNWLRAAVLGANDGIISTASLLVGVAAAGASGSTLLITGVAAVVAGAMSMAAGEYVSVSSQFDSEKADLAREAHALKEDRETETLELTNIYIERGLDKNLAKQVALQLMDHNALEAHARDELGISHITDTNPLQAAAASALAFTCGALLPLSTVWLAASYTVYWIMLSTLTALVLLGWAAAIGGGSNPWRAILRVSFWGIFAMMITAGVGSFFNLAV